MGIPRTLTISSAPLFPGGLGRLSSLAVPIALAVVVLGVLVLVARRRFTDIVWCQACQPRNPAGPESFRS